MLFEILKQPNSKKTLQEILEFVGSDPLNFKELMHYFLGENNRITQVASWAIGHLGETNPELLKPYHKELVEQLALKNRHNAVRRNIIRAYQFIEIPEEIEGELYDICHKFILTHDEAIAIRAFSMTVCERIATKYPELIPELIVAIEATIPHGSSGLKNRAGHTSKRLKKLSNC